MKARLTAALALLTSAAADIRPGGRGEIDFKQALVEIQAAIDAPEPEPKTVIQTEIVTGEIANQVATQVQAWMTNVQSSLEGLTTRLGNVETAAGSILTVSQASNDKLDGMEDTLAAFVASNTTPA